MVDLLQTVLSFLVVLTIVVFVHELGHFLVARWNGVRVEVFSIGFGRELVGMYDRKGTRWSLGVLPLGGYVRFFGDADDSSKASGGAMAEMTAEERAVCFHYKPLSQRFAIVAAGPLANFAFAILVFAALFMTYGQPSSAPVIDDLVAGGAAERAGLAPGDRIVAIDGKPLDRFQDLQRVVALSEGEPMVIDLRRPDGDTRQVTIAPEVVETEDGLGNPVKVARLGIMVSASPDDLRRLGPVEALGQAVAQTYGLTADTLVYLGQIISGHRSVQELGGPIRIAQFSGMAAERGMVEFITFIALLSVNLGLLNLFPIPILDGGHLMFYTIEALRGRPLTERAQELGFRFGLAMVVALMILVTWNDIKPASW